MSVAIWVFNVASSVGFDSFRVSVNVGWFPKTPQESLQTKP